MECFFTKSKLQQYLDDALAELDRQKITIHLQNCPHCTGELKRLQEIDEAFKSNFYAEPPKDYWSTVPKIITSRLGLNPRPSAFEKLKALFDGLAVSRKVRWGLTGALVALTLIVFVRVFYVPRPHKSPVADEPSIAQKTSAEPQLADLSNPHKNEQKDFNSETNSEEKIKANKAMSLPPEISAEQNLATRSSNRFAAPQVGNGSNPEKYDSQFAIAKRGIVSLNPHKLNKKPRSYNQKLIPVANTDLLLNKVNSDDSDKKTDPAFPNQWTFAMDRSISSSAGAKAQDNPNELTEAENSFTETLWFAQQSSTLIEKRNIWLSYINRERDHTYRSLGIYNLALVLSQLAEESKDPEMAEKALSFYQEHEKSLRFQMGSPRYQIKLKILQTIINGK
jgi:hypothetical protein